MSSATQKNFEILSGPLAGQANSTTIKGKILILENLCGKEKGDRADEAGEDHSPRDVDDHHDEGPVLHQRVVRQLIGLVSDETKKQTQENRLCKRSGFDCRGYDKHNQAEEEEEIEQNRSRPKDLASKDVSQVPVIKRFSDQAEPKEID